MTALTSLNRRQSDSIRVWHWYDFGCPYCYVAQDRLAILRDRGLHPEILPYPMPTRAQPAGRFDPRCGGSTHRLIERAARAAGLALHWPTHVPNTRRGLAAAEWVRRYQPDLFESFYRQLFAAHFALGQDVGKRNPSINVGVGVYWLADGAGSQRPAEPGLWRDPTGPSFCRLKTTPPRLTYRPRTPLKYSRVTQLHGRE